MSTPNEPCPTCGAPVLCRLGPDYRFNPPCSRPMMWTARCGGDCLDDNLAWTSFTRERSLELWNNGVRATIAKEQS